MVMPWPSARVSRISGTNANRRPGDEYQKYIKTTGRRCVPAPQYTEQTPTPYTCRTPTNTNDSVHLPYTDRPPTAMTTPYTDRPPTDTVHSVHRPTDRRRTPCCSLRGPPTAVTPWTVWYIIDSWWFCRLVSGWLDGPIAGSPKGITGNDGPPRPSATGSELAVRGTPWDTGSWTPWDTVGHRQPDTRWTPLVVGRLSLRGSLAAVHAGSLRGSSRQWTVGAVRSWIHK